MTEPTREFAPHIQPTLTEAADAVTPVVNGSTLKPGPGATPPGGLSGYELLNVVGQGGMGVVFRARDLGLNRDVAVKLLQDKYATDSAVARRFVEEARITGQLQHPGIPPVHEVGTLADGRPFLVMKLIKGRTLADLLANGGRESPVAEQPGVNTPRSLSLIAAFEQVCQAVGYAHDHGVIHRDLKPQNIMIGAFGEVQVMDWGLAKFCSPDRPATSDATAASTFVDPRKDTDESLHTHTGAILGTPAYISPEQAIGAIDQIDQRADVFGLGAILCSILTGQPPFVADTPQTSRLLAAQGKLSPAFARLDACGAEPELVALCKRCLSPERENRPRNAGEVAAAVAGLRAAAEERARRSELERTAAQVQAAEQRKRRKVLSVAAAVVTLVLTAAAGVSLWQARVARAEADNARNAERTAQEQAANARTAEAAAIAAKAAEEQERLNADATVDFIKTVLAFTTSAGQGKDPKKVPTVREALDRAAASVQERFQDRPLVEAKVRKTIGEVYYRLQAYPEAAVQYERILAIRRSTAGPDAELTWAAMNDLGEVYKRMKRYDQAEELLKTALASKRAKLGNDNRSTQRTVNNLGGLYRDTGRFDEAEPLLREAYETRRRVLGRDDSDSLNSTNNLGALHMKRGNPAAAEPYFREAAEGYERTLGIRFESAQCWSNVADSLLAQKRYADAVPVYHKALGILDRITPEEGRGLRTQIAGQLVKLYTEWGKPEEAARWKPKQPEPAPPPRPAKQVGESCQRPPSGGLRDCSRNSSTFSKSATPHSPATPRLRSVALPS